MDYKATYDLITPHPNKEKELRRIIKRSNSTSMPIKMWKGRLRFRGM
jgi:hypothetical protein